MLQLAAYFKEREGFESLITDEGFATYQITGAECYVRDIWVHRDFRKKHVASQIANRIAEIARKEGCHYLTGSVSTIVGNPTTSTKVLLAYGFQIHSTVQNGIIFRKEL